MKVRSVASQAAAKRKESRISNSASIVTDEAEEPALEESSPPRLDQAEGR